MGRVPLFLTVDRDSLDVVSVPSVSRKETGRVLNYESLLFTLVSIDETPRSPFSPPPMALSVYEDSRVTL